MWGGLTRVRTEPPDVWLCSVVDEWVIFFLGKIPDIVSIDLKVTLRYLMMSCTSTTYTYFPEILMPADLFHTSERGIIEAAWWLMTRQSVSEA
jgi:hypothetical protein